MSLALLLLLASPSAAARPPAPLWTEAPNQAQRPSAPPASISSMVKASMPAVVGIIATTARGGDQADPFKDFLEKMYGKGPGSGSEAPVRGIGTGFFIRADGIIATNGHVVEGATDITVQVGEEERAYRGVVVGKDDATDLALVKIEGAAPFPILQLGDSEKLEVGEWVVAIGNPFGLSRSVTTGIVSFKSRRDVNPSGRPGYYDFIQTDAAINPGNSGGPLLDARGAVIGINAAVNPAGQGIGFAIPINMLREISPQLERGQVIRGWLGLLIQEQLTPELAESFGVARGVLVTEIEAGGPASQSGLLPGDIITSFNGEPVSEAYRLRWLTAKALPGEPVKLALVRAGKARMASITPIERPGTLHEQARPAPLPRKDQEPFGFTAEELVKTDELDPGHGMRVVNIDLRGPAYRAGVREGDVILEVDGQPVPDRLAFRKALQNARGNVSRLLVRRGARVVFFGLRREKPSPSAQESAR